MQAERQQILRLPILSLLHLLPTPQKSKGLQDLAQFFINVMIINILKLQNWLMLAFNANTKLTGLKKKLPLPANIIFLISLIITNTTRLLQH